MANNKNKKSTDKKVSISISIVIIIVFIIMAFLSYILPYFFIVPHENNKYSFVDSKYANVKTAFSKNKNNKVDAFIEYPVTKNQQINSIVLDYVNQIEDKFYSDASQPYILPRKKPYILNISYQIKYSSEDFISLVINSSQKTSETALEKQSRYWTFDLNSGSEVTLKELFGDVYPDATARTILYIKKSINEQFKNKKTNQQVLLDTYITPEKINSFIASGRYDLEFIFSPDDLGGYHSDTISVNIPINRLQLFLQNQIAKKIFSSIDFTSSQNANNDKPTRECQTKKCIAITFDDGPSAYTANVLDILNKYDGKATFFLIGKNIEKRPQAVKQIARQGSEIGSHTWSHPALPALSPDSIDQQIIKTNKLIKSVANVDARLLRPPYGAVDQTVSRMAIKNSMSIVLWSVDTRDWAEKDSSVIYNRVVANSTRGSIVILHDVHKPSIDALEKIIKKLTREGYKLVTVSDILGTGLKPGAVYSRM